MRYAAIVFMSLALVMGTSVSGQQQPAAPRKPAPNKSTTQPKNTRPTDPASGFVCPDADAAEGCKSFIELQKAGDPDVTPSSEKIGYVCFRPQSDEFFVLEISDPLHSKGFVPDQGATFPAHGRIPVFVNGIEDSSTIPISFFSGNWTYLFDSWVFSANNLNLAEISDKDHDGVTANSTQFTASFRYKNRLDKLVDYSLVVQLSTGRFSEKYTSTEPTPALISEKNGRCTHMPLAKPKPNK